MPILRYFTSCVSRSKTSVIENNTKSYMDNDDLDVFYTNDIPETIKDLLVYIAQEGVAVVDLFRRPGNTQHIKRVIRQLKRGESIDWNKYNFYTLANIVKRYLLQIDKGILGAEVESDLIDTLDLPDDQSRLEAMTCTLQLLSPEVKELLALLFGTWFRMIYHSEVNAMSVEAVAKSVAGSIFPSCTINPNQVNKASKVMEYLIVGFASPELFGAPLIEYFTVQTQTSISRIEKYKYEFIYPKNVPKKKSTRLFVRMLLEESAKHGFDLLKDEVSEEQFNAIDNCIHSHDFVPSELLTPTTNLLNGIDGDNKTRKRRLSKTMTYPYSTPTQGHADQVQQTSEKRTCVTASATDICLTTTQSTLEFDVSQECVHKSDLCINNDDQHSLVISPSSPVVISRKTARLDISDDVQMNDVIKSELLKMQLENSTKGRTQSLQVNGGRFSRVKLQQLERLQKRSDWFLSAPAGCKSDTLMQLSPTSQNYNEVEFSNNGDGRPMSAEIWSENTRNGRFSDYYSRYTKEASLVTNTNGADTKQSVPTQISLSDPVLFQSCSGDQNHASQDNSEVLINPNNSSLSDEQIAVRYFVMRKYYGPVNPRSEE